MIGLALFAVSGLARAEIVSELASEVDIVKVPKGSKVMFSGAGDDLLREAGVHELAAAGYVVIERGDSEYLMQIKKLELTVVSDGKTRTIEYKDTAKDENQNIVVAAAIKKSDLAKVADGKQVKLVNGKIRSAFDMDGGVITQGARLTGSGAGGVVVGVLGALVGKAVDSLVSRTDAPSQGVVKLVGTIFHKDAKGVKFFIIAAASTSDEKPQALFDAAIKKYVELAKTGYKVPVKIDATQAEVTK